MEKEINERVEQLIKELGMNANSFADAIKVKAPVIYNIIGGRFNKPSFELLQKMIIAFANINLYWLMTGKGKILLSEGEKSAYQNAYNDAYFEAKDKFRGTQNDVRENVRNHVRNEEKDKIKRTQNDAHLNAHPMPESQNERYTKEAVENTKSEQEDTLMMLSEDGPIYAMKIPPDKKKSAKNQSKLEREIQPVIVTVDNAGRENIAMVASKAYAGYAQHFTEPEFYQDLPTFALPTREFRNATYRCFEVSGESMSQTLFNSDWVIGRYCDPWPTGIREGYIYVIVTNETIYVKRVINRIPERGKLVLLSDNEQFISMEIDASEVRELWYVKAKLSFYMPNIRHGLSHKFGNMEADMMGLRAEVQKIKKMLNIE